MRVGHRVIELQGFHDRSSALRHEICRSYPMIPQSVVAISEPGVSHRIFWIEGNRLLEILYAFVYLLPRGLTHEVMPFKEGLVCLQVLRIALAQLHLLFRV